MDILNNISTVILTLLGGGTIGVLAKVIVDRKKVDAETKNINITGELQISERTLEYADSLRHDIETLKRDYAKLKGLMDELTKENRELKEENLEKDLKITALQEENKRLHNEVEMLREELNLIKKKIKNRK